MQINVHGSISAQNVQIGENNSIERSHLDDRFTHELTNLINAHCATEGEKQQLLQDLRAIQNGNENGVVAGRKLYDFVSSVAGNVASSGLLYAIGRIGGVELP